MPALSHGLCIYTPNPPPSKHTQDLGLPFEVSAINICEPEAREMMVLLLYLYQTLPQFVPRTIITFACKLGEMQVRVRACACVRACIHVCVGQAWGVAGRVCVCMHARSAPAAMRPT